jgi:hypothetical protein
LHNLGLLLPHYLDVVTNPMGAKVSLGITRLNNFLTCTDGPAGNPYREKPLCMH